MLTIIDRWFAQVAENHEYKRSEYSALLVILVIGTIARFWGLGNVGLHGDEETMALAAMAVLADGQPILPSGMYYSRGLLNVYLMSSSVWLFGESEWALRLPSAIVGSLMGLAAFFMGRRFLPPQFNLMFVATITLLPSMIIISQTARMYVFFVTCIVWFAACLFRWERDQRLSSLMLALIVWMLSLHFHRLAVFAAPLFFFPALTRQSWRLLIQGALAFFIGLLFFRLYSIFISAKYPEFTVRPEIPDEPLRQIPIEVLGSVNEWSVIAAVGVILVFLAILLAKVISRYGWGKAIPPLLLGAGLLALSVLHYHVAAILLLFGTVFWLRDESLPQLWLGAPLLLAAVIVVAHLGALYQTGFFPGRKLIGAVVGTPSVWPVLRFLEHSPVAGVVYAIAALRALSLFVRGERLAIHFLFFAMAVWIPLFMLGFFASYIPPRYGLGQLGYFLMCTFAGLTLLAHQMRGISADSRVSWPGQLFLVITTVALINPFSLAQTVNPTYDTYPDHKGAAEFIKSLDLEPDTVLIAEDVIQQTYYLKEVDYSLRPIDDAVYFSVLRDGQVVDQYTGVPVLGTGAELEAVLNANVTRDVYIIGSGENFVKGRRLLRGQGIEAVLESSRLTVVFDGRDGKTKVWKSQ